MPPGDARHALVDLDTDDTPASPKQQPCDLTSSAANINRSTRPITTPEPLDELDRVGRTSPVIALRINAEALRSPTIRKVGHHRSE
jgi:hypothetical protein